MGIFEKCLKKGKWPIHWDERPYHTIRYNGMTVRGNRNMKGRFDWLKIPADLSGKNVLDIGCNAGEVSKECYDRGAKVYGFDVSKHVINLARQVHPGPEYFHANINKFPTGFKGILGIEFDIIFCLSIVNHVRSKKLFKLFKHFNPELIIFEGHQVRFNKNKCLKRLCHNMQFDCKLEYIGMSDERLSRPLWHIKR